MYDGELAEEGKTNPVAIIVRYSWLDATGNAQASELMLESVENMTLLALITCAMKLATAQAKEQGGKFCEIEYYRPLRS